MLKSGISRTLRVYITSTRHGLCRHRASFYSSSLLNSSQHSPNTLTSIRALPNMNPYAQWQQGGAAPSIFGALPSLPASNPPTAMPDSVTFTFTNFKTTILNSTVFGPQQRTAYRVVTEATAPACTIFKDNESRNVAMVQWQPHATVEIRGVAAKQRVRDWLRLSSDQRYVNSEEMTHRRV